MEGRDQNCSYLLIACLPRDTATFCVSKGTQMSGTRELQVEIQVFSFHFQGKTKGYTTAISGIKERLLSMLVIQRKEEMASHFNS